MARIKLQTPNFNMAMGEDGNYVIRWTEDGQRRKKSTQTGDPVAAEKFRANFVQSYNKPELSERPTVAELADAYVAYRTPLVASPESLNYSFAPLRRHLGLLYADTITQTVVNGYGLTRAAERPSRGGGRYGDNPVSEATISKELRMLRAALNWAASEKKIANEPTFRIELSTGDARTDWLTKDEANRLLPECADHVAMFALIALGTAKRREAILGLEWPKVSLHLPGHELIDFGANVGNKLRGSTPIAGNKRLIEALKAGKDAWQAKKDAGANDLCDAVIQFRGERILDVKTALSAACVRAGIRHISAHTFKHTAITWMVQAGTSFERIAKFANTSKEMIEKVYGHHSPEFLSEISNAVSF